MSYPVCTEKGALNPGSTITIEVLSCRTGLAVDYTATSVSEVSGRYFVEIDLDSSLLPVIVVMSDGTYEVEGEIPAPVSAVVVSVPTAAENREEMDENSTRLEAIYELIVETLAEVKDLDEPDFF